MKVLAISGSLRRDSYNTKLLRAAEELLPPRGRLRPLPGRERSAAVRRGGRRPAGADGGGGPAQCNRRGGCRPLATPEYNSSIPGSLKNALDWVSRPVATNPLRNKPVAVVGASTGAFGAVWAQAELRKVLAAIGARVVDGEVAVGHAPTRFDENGRLEDESLQEQLEETIEALLTEADARSLVLA